MTLRTHIAIIQAQTRNDLLGLFIKGYKMIHIDFVGYNKQASVEENLLQFRLVGPNSKLGYVQDIIDKNEHNDEQLPRISLGRGDDDEYGNIDVLDPAKYHDEQMCYISLGCGSSSKYGNIDSLSPVLFDAEQMMQVSLCR